MCKDTLAVSNSFFHLVINTWSNKKKCHLEIQTDCSRDELWFEINPSTKEYPMEIRKYYIRRRKKEGSS